MYKSVHLSIHLSVYEKVLHDQREVADAQNSTFLGEWPPLGGSNVEKSRRFSATVIGADKSAGVREADGSVNDSWCRLGYL